MRKFEQKILVISLGGSVIVPKEIDLAFLKRFKDFIFKNKDKKFVIVCGGGYTNKIYNEAARKLSKVSNEDLDWIGIKATMLNAELVRSMFSKIAYEKFIEPIKKIKTNKRIIICSGWKPGWSSDYDAVLLAKNFGAKVVVNLSNIDYIYDKDPKKFKNAKPLKSLTWKNYKQLVASKWIPRLNTPFDPIASRLAEKWGMEVAVMRGTDLNNFQKFLNGKKFKGTMIN
jgi:uridylate kinase